MKLGKQNARKQKIYSTIYMVKPHTLPRAPGFKENLMNLFPPMKQEKEKYKKEPI